MVVDVVQENQFAIPENGSVYSTLTLLSDNPDVTFTKVGTDVQMTISVMFTPALIGAIGGTPIPSNLSGCSVIDFDKNVWAIGTIMVQTGLSSDMAKISITTNNLIIEAEKGKLGSTLSLTEDA